MPSKCFRFRCCTKPITYSNDHCVQLLCNCYFNVIVYKTVFQKSFINFIKTGTLVSMYERQYVVVFHQWKCYRQGSVSFLIVECFSKWWKCVTIIRSNKHGLDDGLIKFLHYLNNKPALKIGFKFLILYKEKYRRIEITA